MQIKQKPKFPNPTRVRAAEVLLDGEDRLSLPGMFDSRLLRNTSNLVIAQMRDFAHEVRRFEPRNRRLDQLPRQGERAQRCERH
jgi:hypothetical protein